MMLPCRDSGEMAEWLKAAVLKTVVGKLTGGSNPSLSASIFFQYFNSSNPCLQAIDSIDFFYYQ